MRSRRPLASQFETRPRRNGHKEKFEKCIRLGYKEDKHSLTQDTPTKNPFGWTNPIYMKYIFV